MDKKKKILLVDDDVDYTVVLEDTLSEWGYEVNVAHGGIEALDLANTKKYSLVISDIRMPHGNGIELLLNLRQKDRDYPPVILMTGYTYQDFQDLIEKGAHCILNKPFELSELESKINEVI